MTPEAVIREARTDAIALVTAMHHKMYRDAHRIYADAREPEAVVAQLGWLFLALLEEDEETGGPTVTDSLVCLGRVNASTDD